MCSLMYLCVRRLEADVRCLPRSFSSILTRESLSVEPSALSWASLDCLITGGVLWLCLPKDYRQPPVQPSLFVGSGLPTILLKLTQHVFYPLIQPLSPCRDICWWRHLQTFKLSLKWEIQRTLSEFSHLIMTKFLLKFLLNLCPVFIK